MLRKAAGQSILSLPSMYASDHYPAETLFWKNPSHNFPLSSVNHLLRPQDRPRYSYDDLHQLSTQHLPM
ncbi:hypothetical protein G6F37_014193 [Rhizopus arrhizus]|nr:hypothetical protein G6F37_014193 [Rhizopus arrhizus]